MNRRSFTAALMGAPFAMSLGARLIEADGFTPQAARRFSSPMDDFAWLTAEVQLAWTERAARGLRNSEAHDPFDGLVGEFYVTGSQRVDIPDHLPGTMTTYDTVVGVAAVKGTIHVGAFRRGTFVWTVRMSGEVEYAVEAAEAISGFELPDPSRIRLAPSLLNDLLPTPADFSRTVTIVPD